MSLVASPAQRLDTESLIRRAFHDTMDALGVVPEDESQSLAGLRVLREPARLPTQDSKRKEFEEAVATAESIAKRIPQVLGPDELLPHDSATIDAFRAMKNATESMARLAGEYTRAPEGPLPNTDKLLLLIDSKAA